MRRTDRKRWAEARTLADLGELTAQWVTGHLTETPGHGGPPDPETTPLITALAALNRSGFVTENSQPGDEGTAYDGKPYQQRAWVEAFTDPATAHRVERACRRAGLTCLARPIPARSPRNNPSIPITIWGGRVCTAAGHTFSARHFHSLWTQVSDEALAALCASWQVTVVDPEWGRRPLLWSTILAAVR